MMDSNFAETVMEILMNLAVLSGLMASPPEDLMSVVPAEQVLKTWEQDSSSAALIALLEGRQAGGVKKAAFDLAGIQKRLHEGNAKERRAARAEINAAGADAREDLTTLSKDADPEVATAARERLATLGEEEAALKAKTAAKPDLRPWAARRLGQLKFAAAKPVLEKLAKDEDLTLSRECRKALAAIEGKKADPAVATTDLATLARGLNADPCLALVADLRRGASSQSLNERLAALPKGTVPALSEDMQLQLARAVSQLLDQTGNFEIHGIAISLPSTLGEDANHDDHGHARFIVSGCFDSKRIQALCKNQVEDIGGRPFHR